MNTNTHFSVGDVSAEWSHKAQIQTWFEHATTSTNDIAKAEAFSPSNKSSIKLYFANLQHSGRGRGTNTWQSPTEGSSLLSTWSFAISNHPQPVLSPAIGLAVYRALLATWPDLAFSLKAPNDLYLADKKIAGLLIETISQGDKTRLLIGLGLNVFASPGLATAGCLSQFLSDISVTDWCQLLDRILLEITMTISSLGKELSQSQCQSLLWALNHNPQLAEKFTQVLPSGDLQNKSKAINWTEL